MKRVCIDPGHGGHDVGALGPSGTTESSMTLDVCKRIRTLLEPVVDVVMTRDTDVYLTLSERAEICNNNESDVFCSYHFNSAHSMLANGWEVFTTARDNNSDKLATCIGDAHAIQFPRQHARTDWSDGDLDKESNFAVIRRAYCPAVLFEGEFIHNNIGEAMILDTANRQKMAQAVADGICTYLNIKLQPIVPLSLEDRVVRIEKHLNLS
jgi:N-acetylmuramoyl-L-alanine amidase